MSDQLKSLQQELADGTAQLLDVREEDEWDAGHLCDAVLVPLSELRASLEPDDLDKNKKTYLHCRSGRRVHDAAPLLEAMGYTTVIPLDEGFVDLVDEGFSAAENA